MGRDVFISYAHQDSAVAHAICNALEQRSVSCWIAPRDIRMGEEWASSIVAAVDDAQVFVLVFSEHANDSRHVRREVELAAESGCTLAPVRVDRVEPTGSLRYFMSDAHWLDAITAPFTMHAAVIVDRIAQLISAVSQPLEECTASVPVLLSRAVFDLSAPALQFGVLGPLEVVAPDGPLTLGGAKQQTVLGALLLEPNRVVSVERLVDWVWGDDLPERYATLQVYVSNLRRLLATHSEPAARSLVVTRHPGYLIEVEPAALDSLHFSVLRSEAETAAGSGDPDRAAKLLRTALSLWRGTPLAGLPVGAGGVGQLTRLEVARTTAMEQLGRAELDRGRHQHVVDELRGWVSEHPLNEELRGLLMLALYRCGRQAESLSAFREGRELLLDELGIDPSKDLRDLENNILLQDPVLDLVRQPTGRVPIIEGTVLRSSVVAASAHVRLGDSSFALGRTVTTIGRLPDRDIVLSDPGASRSHAEIRSTPDGFLLVDKGSANGTRIGGRRVRKHLLAPGDVVGIGDTEMTFALGPPKPEGAADQI